MIFFGGLRLKKKIIYTNSQFYDFLTYYIIVGLFEVAVSENEKKFCTLQKSLPKMI